MTESQNSPTEQNADHEKWDVQFLREEKQLVPGMRPVEAEYRNLGGDHVCDACEMGFETWQGAYDHQKANCDETAHIRYDTEKMERRIPEETELDWWVGSGGELRRETMDVFEAKMLASEDGPDVSLAEPVRGGPV